MGPETVNRNKNSTFHGAYAGRDMVTLNLIMLQDSDRGFVVTHKADIKPVTYFTGRETELKDLRQRIEEGRKSVLVSGMGGVGKTNICKKLFDEYHRQHAKDKNCPFRYIGYIEYDGNMDSSLQTCLKFRHQDNLEDNPEAAWRELEYLASNGELLLFVDNVNVPMGQDLGLKRLMSIPGTIVLTSRRRTFGKDLEPYRIGFLSTEKCREIYEKIRYENSGKKVAEEEVRDLDYIIDTLAARHTITVEFLAHLAWVKHWTAQELRSELEENGFQLEYMDEEDQLVNIQKSYETLYDMSALTEAEQHILEGFSVFPYIPLEARTCNEWLLADAGVSEGDDILMGLYQKGWLQYDVDQESYALHPVFAQFIYDKCKPGPENHPNLIAACQRRMAIPESGTVLKSRKYIPFAENMIEKLNMENNLKQIGFILDAARLLYYVGEYKKAERLYEKDLRIRERVLGEEHQFTAVSYSHLARVYDARGEYEKAEELYKKSLRIREKVLGEEHLDTARSYNNLAVVYYAQGEYEKAEELYEKSLRIGERILGEEHPSIAVSYNNLAVVYDAQGEYEKAEELYKKSLRIRERVLGEEHPSTAECYHNLAWVYTVQGEYEKAEELHEKSLRIRKRVLGEEHPSTATSYNGLAEVYRARKEYKKAEKLYEKSLRIRERVLGENHLDTAVSRNNLAVVYKAQGEYEKAEELHEKSLRIMERVLGEDHPDTAANYNNLAELYKDQRKYQKAMRHYLKSYNILLVRLGINHPSTRKVLKNMNIAYYEWKPEGNFSQWLKQTGC